MLDDDNKNYRHLVDKAEGAFLKKEYLEAFLIQSCIAEGVIKNYARAKLSPIISQSSALSFKFDNFEMARLIDELLISGKISKELFEDLNSYRKKRNEVIHGLLKYTDIAKLDEELKSAYELGRNAKTFIVDDMSRGVATGETVAELKALVSALLAQIKHLEEQLKPGNGIDTRAQISALLAQIGQLQKQLGSINSE